ncbi:RidA family protein [Montanilutibacter psychrotolerans]|uniref:RidA family protein n=1 Tax=Montanilutibacter psychrotolerans TaxID=1327343 RepID=A0A3M8SN30_9GAMM|nr:RidA family protein [Lysobacter psychrotolerans]RNF82788.1 RidA family protein [Lysobacter psychrotolerans]
MNDLHRTSVVALSNPAGLYDPAPNGYSHVAIVDGARRWILIAGQGGETVDGRLAEDFRSQVRQAFANLHTALASAGARATDVAKLTVLVVDHSLERLQVFGSELETAFGPHKPACTLIPVPRLALDGMLFEIEALAALGE